MSYILGLDVSTSITGICLLDSKKSIIDNDYIIHLDFVNFKKCKTLWEKSDLVSDYFCSIAKKFSGVDAIAVEEPLMGFRAGMSSAQTISALMKFNGIVSFISREFFKVDPVYFNSANARKLCGIKMQKTKVAGPQKEQVFKHMAENDLKNIVWQKKKNGESIDASRDMCDAYVIARAFHLSSAKK
jgi:hypothetical protein